MSDNLPFTFIIGCPRSGTTLLRAMLDSHPEFAVPPEAYFLVQALRRADRYRTADGIDRRAVLDDVTAHSSWAGWQLDPAVLDGIADDGTLMTVPAVLRAVYDAYAARSGKALAIDKTPRHTEHVGLLIASFPGARFIHLVRDGRDVVPSMRAMPYFPQRFADAALYWRGRVLAGRDARATAGAGRYHELRYEDLVTDPERNLEELCAFLGVGFVPEMLEYTSRADQVISGMYDSTYHENVRRAPSRTRDWRETMPERQVRRFEALAGDALAMFGYERGPTPSVLDRAEALSRHGLDTAARHGRIVRARVRRRLPGS